MARQFYLLLLLLSLAGFSAFAQQSGQGGRSDTIKTPRVYSSVSGAKPKNAFSRDSLFVRLVVDEFMKIDTHGYEGYMNRGVASSIRQIYVDTLLYSPDSLKLFAIIVIKTKNNHSDEARTNDWYYHGNSVVGIRGQPGEPWALYPYDRITARSFSGYRKASLFMRNSYLRDFKYDGEVNKGPDGKNVFMKYLYNVGEARFWSESIVWKKDLRIRGYYNFQLKGFYPEKYLDQALVRLPDVSRYYSLYKP